ncbi:MAG: HAD-IA family hydrolase [Parcubacteria group bacterium]
MKGDKLIIFDFDGVIVDSWEHSYKRNTRDWPDLKPHDHKKFFMGNIYEALAMLPASTISSEETEKWLNEEYYPTKQKLPIFEGIQNVVRKLADKNTLIVNTSATSFSTKEYLTNAGLIDFFDTIYGLEISKDKIQKFNQILKDFNVKPEDCIFITDTVGDVLEAEHCSIKSLVVTYGYQSREYFESIKTEIIGFADKPLEILNFIDHSRV